MKNCIQNIKVGDVLYGGVDEGLIQDYEVIQVDPNGVIALRYNNIIYHDQLAYLDWVKRIVKSKSV